MRTRKSFVVKLGGAFGAVLGAAAGRILRTVYRTPCTLTHCRQVFMHNVQGRHDAQPHGVWRCTRCGRVRLGRFIPSNQE